MMISAKTEKHGCVSVRTIFLLHSQYLLIVSSHDEEPM